MQQEKTEANIHKACEILQQTLRNFSLLKKCNSNPPRYKSPENPIELLEQLKRVSTVFNKDMSLNTESPYAEEYALCLVADGRKEEALKLFKLLANKQEGNLLFLHTPPANGSYHSEEVSPIKGKLGYESLLQYAKLLQDDALTVKVLMEIVEKIPAKCSPISLQDTRVIAIKMLQSRGITWLTKRSISEVLAEALRYQY